MSTIQLSEIIPEFRNLVDLILFSNRMDIDLSKFNSLLNDKRKIHLDYLFDIFNKACDIYWENGNELWYYRLFSLFSFEDSSINKYISKQIEHRMFSLIRSKKNIDKEFDLQYLQFIEYCKVKHARHENLQSVKNYLIELSPQIDNHKIINIIISLTPFLFKDIGEYASAIANRITISYRNFEILQSLENYNIKIDKQPIVQLAKELLSNRSRNNKNISAFYAIIDNQEIISQLKSQYIIDYRAGLIDILENSDYRDLEDRHLRNMKNIIFLDPVIADNLALIYAQKLYARYTWHKKANADRLIRLMKTFPQISPKKIFAYLASNNKITDIKYMLVEFPSLRKLAAFM